MSRSRTRWRRSSLVAVGSVLGLLLAACGSTSTGSSTTANAACDKFDASVLNNRPIPASLDPDTAYPAPGDIGKNNTADTMGAPQALVAKAMDQIMVTPDQVKAICGKHLTAVFLDWSNVTYNKAIESGVKNEFSALGVNLLRITDSEFQATGLQGNLAAVLPLNPDIIIVGGTIDPAQMSSIMAPAVSKGKTIVAWGDGGPGMDLGVGKAQAGLIAYDWYHLGQQMATAVHNAYPQGANLGYIHWINDVQAILLREQGFLDGLKQYPNIHIVTSGGPADPKSSNSGFNDPNNAEPYTEAFLQAHPEVNVIFAPWEDPPALGEQAAIKALHLEDKLKVVTMDLAEGGATSLRSGGLIKVDMGQDVYDGGRMLALTGALAGAKLQYEPFVNVPTFAVTGDNVKDSWDFMHGPDLVCGADVCG